MKTRFQKSTQLFNEEDISTKPCVNPTSEIQTASHFEKLFLVEAKYFNSFIINKDFLQKTL